MIASFASGSITRLRAEEYTDSHGNTRIDWDEPDEKTIEYPAAVAPVAGSETFDAAGQELVTRWTVNVHIDADIQDDDRIRFLDTEYDIDGNVQHCPSPSGARDHLKFMLKRVN